MIRLAFSLSVKELRHDWQAALCFVAALVGILAPLLVVLAIKNGVVGNMVERLIEDPSNRELIPIGAGHYTDDFFANLRSDHRVAFVIPRTRSINTLADAFRNKKTRKSERTVALVPSAKGDPLLGDMTVAPGEIILSQPLAHDLQAKIGDELEIVIGREIDGATEVAKARLKVVGVAPLAAMAKKTVFLAVEDLLKVEKFRDDKNIIVEAWFNDLVVQPQNFASFRLYVKELSDLSPVKLELQKEGVEVRPKATNAAVLLEFQNKLNVIYACIAALAVTGFWAAMAANLRGMVERQRIAFSLLRFLGLSEPGRKLIPLIQGQILVLIGVGLTFVLLLPILAMANAALAGAADEKVATLSMADILATVAICSLTAMTAAVWALRAVSSISAKEVLQNV